MSLLLQISAGQTNVFRHDLRAQERHSAGWGELMHMTSAQANGAQAKPWVQASLVACS